MAHQVPERIRNQRRNLAMAAQHEVARDISASWGGRTMRVLVESQARSKELSRANVFSWEHGLIRESQTRNSELGTRNFLVARGEADAPDIDGRVYVRGKLPLGEFAQVKIVGHTDYDLIAEPAQA
jgi:ribosomal protein S12 methylthiotransferase